MQVKITQAHNKSNTPSGTALPPLIPNFIHLCFLIGDPPSIEAVTGPYPETEISASDSSQTVVIAHAPGYGKYLGRLDLTFDMFGNLKDWNGNPILLGKTAPEGIMGYFLLSPLNKLLINKHNKCSVIFSQFFLPK